jgi:hypothetical protein
MKSPTFHLRSIAFCLAMACAMSAPAAETAALAADQRQLAERYQRMEVLALRIAELSDAENPARAAQLRRAVQQSKDFALAEKFTGLVDLLREEQLAAAIRDQQQITAELSEVLRTLLEDPSIAEEAARKALLKKLQQGITDALRKQRNVRSKVARGAELGAATEEQAKLEAETKALEAEAKQADPSDPGPTPEPPAEGEGNPSPNETQPSDAAGRLKAAAQSMGQAQTKLQKGEREQAQEPQLDAEQQLELAKQQIEEQLRQQREEELARLLADLGTRLRQMLEQETSLREETAKRFAAAPITTTGERDREFEIAALQLADRQAETISLAERTLLLLAEDGQSVAFLEALRQIREDMLQVAARLKTAELGPITQQVEQEIIDSLSDAVDAVDAAIESQQAKKSAPPNQQQGQPGQQPLVDKLAELRMIRAMQARIQSRTKFWSTHRESAEPAAVRAELARLAEQQRRLVTATEQLAAE